MKVTPIKTRIFEPGEDLVDFIVEHVPKLEEESVLIITSKIVALAENRIFPCKTKEDKIKLIKQESKVAIETPYTWLTIKDGEVMMSAGIDESNIGQEGMCLLLPEDSYKTAQVVREKLTKHYAISELGVIITDSRTVMFQMGTTCVSLGYAGFEPIHDYRGKKDIHGRKFKVSRSNLVQSLAAASGVVMGEGSEQTPLGLINGVNLQFTDKKAKRSDLYIDPKDDVYSPLFSEQVLKDIHN